MNRLLNPTPEEFQELVSSIPRITVLLPVICFEDWQQTMTEAAVDIMQRCTDMPFHLVLLETESKKCGHIPELYSNVSYEHFPQRTSLSQDLNRGIDKYSKGTDYFVHTGNDIFVKPGWLEALLECFALRRDCGIATLAASDMKHEARDAIEEGVYGPIFMFRKGWRFDSFNFPSIFSDTDLIMQAYKDGYRSYRNWKIVVGHLYQQTYSLMHTEETRQRLFAEARQRFIAKHSACGQLMFRILAGGDAV